MPVKLKSKILLIPADEIKPNDYNPNFVPQELYDDIVDDIKRNGFYGAIIINKDKVIIDGEHRWRALKALGVPKIPCILEEDADEKQSKILTLRLNRERGYLVPVETGAVLETLVKDIPIDILAEATQIPQDEINILTSTKFDPKHQDGEKTDDRIQWGNVEQMVSNLADEVKKYDGKFINIHTVSKGGFIPARLLADRLGIEHIIVIDQIAERDLIHNEPALFVDDIYDTGKTYRKYAKKAKIAAFLHIRKGAEKPKNVIAALETEGSEYVVYPWDKHEFKRSMSTSKRKK